jgi:4-hydroxythreonine-4-phosphate dehydrogenase
VAEPHIVPGRASIESGRAALRILQQARADLEAGHAQAVVTCPVSKAAIRHTDARFTGHTEFFAADAHDVLMTFWGEHFNVALLTTHLAVCEVAGA